MIFYKHAKRNYNNNVKYHLNFVSKKIKFRF